MAAGTVAVPTVPGYWSEAEKPLTTIFPRFLRTVTPEILGRITLIGGFLLDGFLNNDDPQILITVTPVAPALPTSMDAKMRPVPGAIGPHTTFKVGPNGRITNYQTWYPQTNPQNPAPWQSGPRVDVTGGDHGGIPTPHVHEPDGTVRPAIPGELPGP